MIRALDIVLSFIALIVGLPVLIVVFVLMRTVTPSPILMQPRVGRDRRPFPMITFRTMSEATPLMATHCLEAVVFLPYGNFLRRTKLDEIPQLINVLRGDMSLVGPRPCLYTQVCLIKERDLRNVFSVRPGITGLAQVSGLTMSTPTLLARIDAKMLRQMTFKSYFRYLVITLIHIGIKIVKTQ